MSGKPMIARVALAEQVTSLLEERILDRFYRPGERLNIDALSREFEVSSSPIREALTRLSAMGFVISTSFSGFSVTPVPSREWFEQLLEYRIIAEGWAASQLARRRTPDAIARMTDSLNALQGERLGRRARDYIPANRADAAFHEAMLDNCGNEILTQSVRNLRPHLHHARLFSRMPQNIAPVIQEHRAILDAIIAGDEVGASVALQSHLRASWQRYDGWMADETDGRSNTDLQTDK
jgi:DNA-binding GntR family transcriptional regulator